MAIFASPNIVTNGLVLCLDAANRESYPGTGTTWFDIGGTNSGILTNGPIFNNENSGGIVFDGVNDYIEISNNTVLNPTDAVTLCSFFRISGYGSNYAPIIFKKNTRSGNYEQYSLYVQSNVIGMVISNTVGTQEVMSIPYTYGMLIFATAVFNVAAGRIELYKNAILENSRAISISFDISTEPLRIGGMPNIFTGYANGTIYTAQIYNRALSASEIRQNYLATRGRFGL